MADQQHNHHHHHHEHAHPHNHGHSHGPAAATVAPGPDGHDAVIVGAGFAGMYMLHKMRSLGFSAVAIEAGSDVGGTWFWNRYPGARCDITTLDYQFSFDPELLKAWTWSEKYATQPEILRYANFVADRYQLRRDITFNTRVDKAHWDEASHRWKVHLSDGKVLTPRFYIMATGCLSTPKQPDIPGVNNFKGTVYFTSRWPAEPVDFTGKRVAVVGTGSSGIQSIPKIAQQAAQLTVFQRTASYTFPARNGQVGQWQRDWYDKDPAAYFEAARYSPFGAPFKTEPVYGRYAPPEVRNKRIEAAWNAGELASVVNIFADELLFEDSAEHIAEFLRQQIRATVKDPATADMLCPRDYPFMTKRPCLDTDYYVTFNRPNVRLVDLRRTPISTITADGINVAAADGKTESLPFDAIVYATGFDAVTGPLVAVDIAGRGGQTLKAKWANGPQTYLGLTTVGFPNFFFITGPQSPSVLSNMFVSIEQHVDLIADCLVAMRKSGVHTVEPTEAAEAGWVQHSLDCIAITNLSSPKVNSWYVGANVAGKPRAPLPYIGGVDAYRRACNDMVKQGWLGFRMHGASGQTCNDGVVRRLQPDILMVATMLAPLNLPTFDSLPPAAGRAMLTQMNAMRPPGPQVGEIKDGSYPGAAGPLPYRLYRPATPGPHPVVLYFHGGGWVLGDINGDDPLLRDLCKRSNALIVSCSYRLAPEAPFPAAADDAMAALRWVAEHAQELGGVAGQLAVAGYSAGGNLAAGVARRARDEKGPKIAGQALLVPVVDADFTRQSYIENGEHYVLTTKLMNYFWDHYCPVAQRSDPRVALLKADLAGLPPAMIVTSQFDPLRDEGRAYAAALKAAGVSVEEYHARGHTHTSPAMVDMIVSGEPIRAAMAAALRGFFPKP